MELTGKSPTMKDSNTQDLGNNCHPNPLSNQKNRGESDVGLLVACKIQLSSEVIRWKTETLRLKKEKDSVQCQAKDLDHKVSQLTEKTKELEDRLLQAEEENKHLRARSHVIDEEKAALVHRLSQSVNKYHSYPWGSASPNLSRFSRLQTSEVRRDELDTSEDWKEVSQKMMQKMKQEMKELQEMSDQFHVENPSEPSREADQVLKGMASLMSETKSLKQHLLEQRRNLQSLLAEWTADKSIHGCYSNPKNKAGGSAESDVNLKYTPVNQKSAHPRHKTPVYLTKQLETLDDLNRVIKEAQHSRSRETSPQHASKRNSKQSPLAVLKDRESAREVKVCPICQESFGAAVSQLQFEEHVLNHLENESTSLLDQYVVL